MSSHGDPDDKQLSLMPEGLGVRITYLASKLPSEKSARTVTSQCHSRDSASASRQPVDAAAGFPVEGGHP